jgi:antitoxin ParD1/3/4
MSKKTSILLRDNFKTFINGQLETGKFSSADEVVHAALRLFEQEETKKAELINELIKGEKSGFVKDFNRDTFFQNIKENHLVH